ncbi:MAG: hypothetical protein K2X08_05860 [Chlamydiales bacterium]|nr:hypothetical protein [Chlamydiales bacterium]
MSATSVSRRTNSEDLSRQYLELVENQEGLSKTQEELRKDRQNLRKDQENLEKNLQASNNVFTEGLNNHEGRIRKLEDSNSAAVNSTASSVKAVAAGTFCFLLGVGLGVSFAPAAPAAIASVVTVEGLKSIGCLALALL